MKYCRRLATALILGFAFLYSAGTANASGLTCAIPTSTPVNVLPAGCVAALTNGPITFTNVHASNGDFHNFEIDTLLMFNMNIGTFSASLMMQGLDHDVTTSTTTAFNYLLPNINFETSPTDNSYLADTGPHTFGIAHLIAPFPGGTFKLNFGEAGRPPQNPLELVTSRADTTGPGVFTVTSFFDVFTELSLDGGFNGGTWRVADNDFIPGTNFAGPGSILELRNAVPEPASLMLFGTGVAALTGRRFRRR